MIMTTTKKIAQRAFIFIIALALVFSGVFASGLAAPAYADNGASAGYTVNVAATATSYAEAGAKATVTAHSAGFIKPTGVRKLAGKGTRHVSFSGKSFTRRVAKRLVKGHRRVVVKFTKRGTRFVNSLRWNGRVTRFASVVGESSCAPVGTQVQTANGGRTWKKVNCGNAVYPSGRAPLQPIKVTQRERITLCVVVTTTAICVVTAQAVDDATGKVVSTTSASARATTSAAASATAHSYASAYAAAKAKAKASAKAWSSASAFASAKAQAKINISLPIPAPTPAAPVDHAPVLRVGDMACLYNGNAGVIQIVGQDQDGDLMSLPTASLADSSAEATISSPKQVGSTVDAAGVRTTTWRVTVTAAVPASVTADASGLLGYVQLSASTSANGKSVSATGGRIPVYVNAGAGSWGPSDLS
jgi:hypothetical protein